MQSSFATQTQNIQCSAQCLHRVPKLVAPSTGKLV